jgi:hypothetical protein
MVRERTLDRRWVIGAALAGTAGATHGGDRLEMAAICGDGFVTDPSACLAVRVRGVLSGLLVRLAPTVLVRDSVPG